MENGNEGLLQNLKRRSWLLRTGITSGEEFKGEVPWFFDSSSDVVQRLFGEMFHVHGFSVNHGMHHAHGSCMVVWQPPWRHFLPWMDFIFHSFAVSGVCLGSITSCFLSPGVHVDSHNHPVAHDEKVIETWSQEEVSIFLFYMFLSPFFIRLGVVSPFIMIDDTPFKIQWRLNRWYQNPIESTIKPFHPYLYTMTVIL